mmetsp:Transcript_26457/g.39141  ORF Transcript_26457/g.39141 Transcript_26457/m.39141 type:complete len:299 (+) Transcript_26457:119-1015(+)
MDFSTIQFNSLDYQRSLEAPVESQGRAVLTILYLVVLALCFIIPIFYYFRMHCEDRQARIFREREAFEGFTIEQEGGATREEARAAKRKYREEKRARIKQLFQPVRLKLQSHHFHHKSGNFTKASEGERSKELIVKDENEVKSRVFDNAEGNQSWESDNDKHTIFVEVPKQGLGSTTEIRLVSDMCAICLSNYEIGEEIVWSTNQLCEHVFHVECIERWLMKQRGLPLCPCCRADFVIDPLDQESLDQEDNADESLLERDLENSLFADVNGMPQENVDRSINAESGLEAINDEDAVLR